MNDEMNVLCPVCDTLSKRAITEDFRPVIVCPKCGEIDIETLQDIYAKLGAPRA